MVILDSAAPHTHRTATLLGKRQCPSRRRPSCASRGLRATRPDTSYRGAKVPKMVDRGAYHQPIPGSVHSAESPPHFFFAISLLPNAIMISSVSHSGRDLPSPKAVTKFTQGTDGRPLGQRVPHKLDPFGRDERRER